MLTQGGNLLLLEATKPFWWIDLIFGITDGWWRFTDKKLRNNHALLSAKTWEKLLNDIGFYNIQLCKTTKDVKDTPKVVIAATSSFNYPKSIITLGLKTPYLTHLNQLLEKNKIHAIQLDAGISFNEKSINTTLIKEDKIKLICCINETDNSYEIQNLFQTYLFNFMEYFRTYIKKELEIVFLYARKSKENNDKNISLLAKNMYQFTLSFTKIIPSVFIRIIEHNEDQITPSILQDIHNFNENLEILHLNNQRFIKQSVLKEVTENNENTEFIEGSFELKGREDFSEIEQELAKIWSSILGFEEINVYDSFYDLGGDSILATRMLPLLENKFPGILNITDVFAFPSIFKLAEFIENKSLTSKKETTKDKNTSLSTEEILDLLAQGKLSEEEADGLLSGENES